MNKEPEFPAIVTSLPRSPDRRRAFPYVIVALGSAAVLCVFLLALLIVAVGWRMWQSRHGVAQRDGKITAAGNEGLLAKLSVSIPKNRVQDLGSGIFGSSGREHSAYFCSAIVKNGTGEPISSIDFVVSIKKPGRSVPIWRGNSTARPTAGIEPLEQVACKLYLFDAEEGMGVFPKTTPGCTVEVEAVALRDKDGNIFAFKETSR